MYKSKMAAQGRISWPWPKLNGLPGRVPINPPRDHDGRGGRTFQNRSRKSSINTLLCAGTLVAVAALTACGGGSANGSSTIAAIPAPDVSADAKPKNTSCSVTLYGDSIMSGQSLSGFLASPPAKTLKTMRPAYDVVDKSRAGQSATLGEPDFMNDTNATRIAVIEYGINDAIRKLPLEVSLRRMVALAQSQQRTVVLVGLLFNAGQAYGEIPAKVAADTGAAYVDWPSVPIGGTVDGAHPDQAWSDTLVKKLVQTLDVIAPECASTDLKE